MSFIRKKKPNGRLEFQRDASPGPGSYDTIDVYGIGQASGKGTLIGGASRESAALRDAAHSPGPGQYDVKDSLTRFNNR